VAGLLRAVTKRALATSYSYRHHRDMSHRVLVTIPDGEYQEISERAGIAPIATYVMALVRHGLASGGVASPMAVGSRAVWPEGSDLDDTGACAYCGSAQPHDQRGCEAKA